MHQKGSQAPSRPAGRAYSASPDPLSGLNGPNSNGGEWEEEIDGFTASIGGATIAALINCLLILYIVFCCLHCDCLGLAAIKCFLTAFET